MKYGQNSIYCMLWDITLWNMIKFEKANLTLLGNIETSKTAFVGKSLNIFFKGPLQKGF